MAIILGHGIWVDLYLFLQAMVTHSWLQNKLSLLPFEKRIVFLTLTKTGVLASILPNNFWNKCHCTEKRSIHYEN